MIMHYIVQAIFLFTGIIALWASVFNNDWLFTADNARWVVKRFGRKGARWAYGVVGVVFVSAAIYFYYQISRL
jgi:hypothetical protein